MVTGFFHHIGTFLLLAATALLIVTDISGPVVDNIGILKVQLPSSSSGDAISFGTFGWCIINNDGPNRCSRSQVGYSPADITTEMAGTPYSAYSRDTATSLTKAMILHPIATGLVFIAFVLGIGSGFAGSLLAALVALSAFVVTLVALIIDFVLFAVIRSNVNDQGGDTLFAEYSIGMWTLLASAVCSLLGTVVIFFTCCSARLHKSRNRRVKSDGYVDGPAAPVRTRRRWGNWGRRRY